MALLAFTHAVALLRCTVLGADGTRKLTIMKVTREEWKALLLCVVMPFFKQSTQLQRLTEPAAASAQLSAVSVDNCWLQHPCCVKDSTATKRVRDLRTGCVKPAAATKITKALEEAAALPAPSRRQPSKRVLKWAKLGGYYKLDLYVWGVPVLQEDNTASGPQWVPVPAQVCRRLRVGGGGGGVCSSVVASHPAAAVCLLAACRTSRSTLCMCPCTF